jgi:hypothetical protein
MVRLETNSVEIHNITVKIYRKIDIPDGEYPAPFLIRWMVDNYQIEVMWDDKTLGT